MPGEKREAGESPAGGNEPARPTQLRSLGAAATASTAARPPSVRPSLLHLGRGSAAAGGSSGSRRAAAIAHGRQGRRHVPAASDPAHFRSRRSRRCHGSAPAAGSLKGAARERGAEGPGRCAPGPGRCRGRDGAAAAGGQSARLN